MKVMTYSMVPDKMKDPVKKFIRQDILGQPEPEEDVEEDISDIP